MRKVSLLILLSLFALATSGYAQNITGSMTGRVVDQQGAAVANATVTANEPARNVHTVTKTGDSGAFSIAGLQPGTYSVTVESPGF